MQKFRERAKNSSLITVQLNAAQFFNYRIFFTREERNPTRITVSIKHRSPPEYQILIIGYSSPEKEDLIKVGIQAKAALG